MKFRSTTFSSPQLQREQARRIYNDFLSVNAPNQVRARKTQKLDDTHILAPVKNVVMVTSESAVLALSITV